MRCSLVAPLVLLALTTGSFAQSVKLRRLHATVATETGTPGGGDMVFGDIDGDGFVDAVTSNPIRVWFGDDLGRFVTPPITLLDGDAPELADTDGDGDLDLFAVRTSSTTPKLLYFAYSGNHTFTNRTTSLPFAMRDASEARAGDFDGDGDVDLVVGNRLPANRSFLLNDGTGTFVEDPLAAAASVEIYHARVFDADGDGDLDMAVQSDFDLPTAVTILVNDGSGAFASADVVQVPEALFLSDTGDVEGDGDVDLLLTTPWSGKTVRVLENDGTGAYASHEITDWPYERGARFVDADGDGDLDVITNHYLHRNEGAYPFPKEPHGLTQLVEKFGIVDADGDGDEDLFVFDQLHRLWYNDGEGAFTDVTAALPESQFQLPGLSVADLDRDGHPDVVTVYGVYFADGKGGFLERRSYRGAPRISSSSQTITFDCDSDGDLDVLTFSPAQLWINQGNRTLKSADRLGFTGYPSSGSWAAAADFDGDGDVDLHVPTAQFTFYTSYLVNDGAGNFSAGPALPTTLLDGNRVVTGDVDADGDIDMIVHRYGVGTYLGRNDGAGGFASEPLALQRAYEEIELADLDGDGTVEMIGAADYVDVYDNDGTGSFTFAPARSIASGYGTPSWIGVGDVDRNGALDLFNSKKLYLNVGGAFVDASSSLSLTTEHDTDRAVAVDIDLDGDVDLVGGGRVRIHTNVATQISAANVPAIGKPLAIDLFAEPGAPWTLFMAASVAGPPGMALPVAGSIVRIGGGFLDPNGEAQLRYSVPADPVLVGRQFFLRAVIGTSPRLSNVERVRITDL